MPENKPHAVERRPVESSQIRSVGYIPASRKLHIEFKNYTNPDAEGAVYEYDNVEQELYDGFFVEAEVDGTKRSIGRYFGTRIKTQPTRYPYKKLSPLKK